VVSVATAVSVTTLVASVIVSVVVSAGSSALVGVGSLACSDGVVDGAAKEHAATNQTRLTSPVVIFTSFIDYPFFYAANR